MTQRHTQLGGQSQQCSGRGCKGHVTKRRGPHGQGTKHGCGARRGTKVQTQRNRESVCANTARTDRALRG